MTHKKVSTRIPIVQGPSLKVMQDLYQQQYNKDLGSLFGALGLR